jgi:hypothetical protein
MKHCIVKIAYGSQSFVQFRKWQICEHGKFINHLVYLLCCDIQGFLINLRSFGFVPALQVSVRQHVWRQARPLGSAKTSLYMSVVTD